MEPKFPNLPGAASDTEKRELGKIISVRFSLTDKGIAGSISNDPLGRRKIVFIQGYRPGQSFSGILPVDGEEWECEVARDTEPERSNRGALIVRPKQKLDSSSENSDISIWFKNQGHSAQDAKDWGATLGIYLSKAGMSGAKIIATKHEIFVLKGNALATASPFYFVSQYGGSKPCKWNINAPDYFGYDEAEMADFPAEIREIIIRKKEATIAEREKFATETQLKEDNESAALERLKQKIQKVTTAFGIEESALDLSPIENRNIYRIQPFEAEEFIEKLVAFEHPKFLPLIAVMRAIQLGDGYTPTRDEAEQYRKQEEYEKKLQAVWSEAGPLVEVLGAKPWLTDLYREAAKKDTHDSGFFYNRKFDYNATLLQDWVERARAALATETESEAGGICREPGRAYNLVSTDDSGWTAYVPVKIPLYAQELAVEYNLIYADPEDADKPNAKELLQKINARFDGFSTDRYGSPKQFIWSFKNSANTKEKQDEARARLTVLGAEENSLRFTHNLTGLRPSELLGNLVVSVEPMVDRGRSGRDEDGSWSEPDTNYFAVVLSVGRGHKLFSKNFYDSSGGAAAAKQYLDQFDVANGVMPDEARAAFEEYSQRYTENYAAANIEEKIKQEKAVEAELMDLTKKRRSFGVDVFVFNPEAKLSKEVATKRFPTDEELEGLRLQQTDFIKIINQQPIRDLWHDANRLKDEILGSWRNPAYQQFGLSDEEAGDLRTKFKAVERYLDGSADGLDLVSAWATTRNLIVVCQDLRRGVKSKPGKGEIKKLTVAETPRTLEEKYGAPSTVVEVKKVSFTETGSRYFRCSCNNQTRVSKEEYAVYKGGKTITINCDLCKGVGEVRQ